MLHNYPWHPGPIDESRGKYAQARWAAPGPRLIYVGVVTSQHGLDDLLRAVKLLEKEFPDLCLDIVGDITNPELEKRLIDLQYQLINPSRVIFHGRVPFADVRRYYRNAQIAVFPLWKMENFVCSETIDNVYTLMLLCNKAIAKPVSSPPRISSSFVAQILGEKS